MHLPTLHHVLLHQVNLVAGQNMARGRWVLRYDDNLVKQLQK